VTAPPPRRPWWKRKRTWAAAALWLVAAYPLSRGPVEYAAARGWLPAAYGTSFYGPLEAALPRYGRVITGTTLVGDGRTRPAQRIRVPDPRTRWFYDYVDWWEELGRRHAAPD